MNQGNDDTEKLSDTDKRFCDASLQLVLRNSYSIPTYFNMHDAVVKFGI